MDKEQSPADPKTTPGQVSEDEATRRVRHREELLDEADQESFPASDPPAVFRPERKHD